MHNSKGLKTLPPGSELFSIPAASKILGPGFGCTSLRERIDSGELVEGIHWFDVRRPTAQQRRIVIYVNAVQQEFGVEAAFRS
jgi:hypothetical protein